MSRGDFASRERRIREPVKGLRQRLRIALKAAGITQKFRTDHGRNFEGRFPGKGGDFLIVIAAEHFRLPFDTFEDRPVVFIHRRPRSK